MSDNVGAWLEAERVTRARVLAEVEKTLVGIFDEYDGADSVCYARDEIFALFDKGGEFDPNK